MRDFNLVKADLIKHLKLSFQADNGTIYWYEGTMAALFAMMSFCFDIEHNHKIEVKPVSNADKIRNMSDKDLADLLSGGEPYPWCEQDPCPAETCQECILMWLKQEAKHDL